MYKTQVCLNLKKEKEKQNSDFFFSCGNEISVLKIVYRNTDFKAELTHQLVRLVTETSQVVLLFIFFIWSVLLILFLFANILTCKDEKDF